MKKWMWITITVLALVLGTAAFTIGFVNSTIMDPGRAAVVEREYEGSIKQLEEEQIVIQTGDGTEEVFRLTGSTDLQGEEFRNMKTGVTVRVGVNANRSIVWLRIVR